MLIIDAGFNKILRGNMLKSLENVLHIYIYTYIYVYIYNICIFPIIDLEINSHSIHMEF